MNAEKLRDVLDKHAKWLRNEVGGERADLTGADLADADLTGANLADANLAYANLADADLTRANLADADLTRANLAGANLADANLAYAYLAGANLKRANLADADLTDVNLTGANLADANLTRAKNIPAIDAARLSACPESGAFDGWKKCREGVLVRVRIPAEARRSSATTRKCRAEFVDVLEVIGAEVGISQYDNRTEYRAGQRVACQKWCDDRWQECAGGIHFFITSAEAEAY